MPCENKASKKTVEKDEWSLKAGQADVPGETGRETAKKKWWRNPRGWLEFAKVTGHIGQHYFQ